MRIQLRGWLYTLSAKMCICDGLSQLQVRCLKLAMVLDQISQVLLMLRMI